MAMSSSAKARAFSESDVPRAEATSRTAWFHTYGALPTAKYRATSVRSWGRSVLVSSPTSFTSLLSFAYSLLVSAGGGSERNWSLLWMAKGVTLRHCREMPPAGGQPGVGCHSPGLAEGGA